MKSGIWIVFFSVFFILGSLFLLNKEAFSKSAQDVDPANETDMRLLLSAIMDEYNAVVGQRVQAPDLASRPFFLDIEYARKIRVEGPYKNGDRNIYSFTINTGGNVTNHAGHPQLFGYEFTESGSEVADTISDLMGGSKVYDMNDANGTIHCEMYGTEGRYACATKTKEETSPSGSVTVIVGLHHSADETAFSPPDCSGSDFKLDVTAEDVYKDPNEANLKAFVKGTISTAQTLVVDIINELIAEYTSQGADLMDPAVQARFARDSVKSTYDKIACFTTGDFKHENIYIFTMSPNPPYTVFFNGNNPGLNGVGLKARDEELPGDDKTISGLFERALGNIEAGSSATVNYRWDDPTTTDDDIPDWFVNNSVPGSSPKTSYIEVANFNELLVALPAPPTLFIFGSGFYGMTAPPPSAGNSDGGGCAIAGVTDTHQSTLLNLSIIALVLFSVVFLRRRV